MKNIFLLCLFISINFCNAQEWFASLEVAKKLALVQDKMLFVMWEESTDYPYPIMINTDDGAPILTDLFEDDRVNRIIWEHFIPVKLNESMYPELSYQVKETKGVAYFNKLIDDGIIIMDPNGYILNINATADLDINLSSFIDRYSLSTAYLKQELINYSKHENFITSFNLAAKYLDFGIFVNKDVRPEIIALANIYFDEARRHLTKSDLNNKEAFLQKNELLKIKAYLVLNNPKKALRVLKRIDVSKISNLNTSLYAFLNYTIFKLLKNEEKAATWKNQVYKVNIKRAELIVKNNR